MPEAKQAFTIVPPRDGPSKTADDSTSIAEAPELHVDVAPGGPRVPSIILATIGVLSVLLLAYLAYRLLPVVLLLFVALLFATAIEPVVNWLRRGPFNRSAGILIVYTGLFLLIGLIGFLTVPVFLTQASDLGSV